MSAMRYAASRIGKVAAATRRRQQQSASRKHAHPRPAVERAPEPALGPYNIWEYGNDDEFGPPSKWIKSFSSAEERNAYLAQKRAEREEEERREEEYMRQLDEERARRRAEEAEWAEQQRREAARQAEERRVTEQAENEATAQMGCLGRTCKRAWQWAKGTHTIRGKRIQQTNGGRRRRALATRRNRRKN